MRGKRLLNECTCSSPFEIPRYGEDSEPTQSQARHTDRSRRGGRVDHAGRGRSHARAEAAADGPRGAGVARGRLPWVADLGDGRYRNPVLNADWSDPDAIRVGDDFYLTASSFDRAPGCPSCTPATWSTGPSSGTP